MLGVELSPPAQESVPPDAGADGLLQVAVGDSADGGAVTVEAKTGANETKASNSGVNHREGMCMGAPLELKGPEKLMAYPHVILPKVKTITGKGNQGFT